MRKVWFNYERLRLSVTTYQSGGEGQCNTWTKDYKYILMDLIGNTGRPYEI